MTIGKAIAIAAKQNGLNITQIGAIAGASQTQAWRWIEQEANPRGPHLLRLMNGIPGLPELLGFEKLAA